MQSDMFKSWPDFTGRVHGHPLCWVHNRMLQRCNKSDDPEFHRYGARGIAVDPLFRSSRSFIGWALVNGYKPGLQLDRIDNDGNYSPYNCRFSTSSENNRNRRDNVRAPSGTLAIELRDGWGIAVTRCRSRRRRGYPVALSSTLPPGVYLNGIERLAADGQFQTILAIFQRRALELESKSNDASNP